MTELQKLSCRIEAVKDAGPFELKQTAEAALDQLKRVLTEQQQRIDALEKQTDDTH